MCALENGSMSDREFKRLRDLIYDKCGINLQPAKKTMLAMRLLKRLRVLGMASFSEYLDYLCNAQGNREELVRMLDVVTTNKTEFFRESIHFDFLLNEVLPTLVRAGKVGPKKRLEVWSAGCSTGQEPYTLAMVLSKYFEQHRVGTFSILATDISTRVLAIAQKGIYPEGEAGPVPPPLKRKYLMRGKGANTGYCRVVPEVRRAIRFQRHNLVDCRTFGIRTSMDLIFCRNVVIYFDRATQISLFEKFYGQLSSGGYLFVGHSENLHGINNRFTPVSPAVYRKLD
ncbi:MAG: protein-glutamate O-methyltransferase [Deltaproteobacteria bacterium]|nr:protein-glutamate O-methyltransferase [Deltaproteobacteria bacterium]